MLNTKSPLYQYIQYLAMLEEGETPNLQDEVLFRQLLTKEQIAFAKDSVKRTH